MTNNPGVTLGAWLKAARLAKGILARVFSSQIWLTHAQYAEVEAGVSKWIGADQKTLIPMLLNFSDEDKMKFHQLVEAAKNVLVDFASLFSNDELKPVRLAHARGEKITEVEERAILAVVFSPLPA